MSKSFEEKDGHWVRILFLVFPYIFVVGGFQYIGGILLNVNTSNIGSLYSTKNELYIIFLGALGIFFLIWFFRKFIDKKPIMDLGLAPLKLTDIYSGLFLGFIVMSIGFFILRALNEIHVLGSNLIISEFLLSMLLYFLVALSEEILIRGYVLTNLMGSVNKYVALSISSLIFSLMHIGNYGYSWFSAFELFIGGLMLGLPYIYTRNLWFPISLHFSWNFFQGTIYGFDVSGSKGYSLIKQTHINNNIWNGGDFGFEGSILSIILQMICIVVLYFIFRNKMPFNNNLLISNHTKYQQ
ncbi:membrane protease YdiL (CAAX protease family) [Flavobacterium sp. W4I14]|nr:membrane protease YdiL (CAAX protease family) [Flavobacterium sp. W4I14]